MKIFNLFLGLVSLFFVINKGTCNQIIPNNNNCNQIIPNNNCISFSVGSGTGCAWMCQYCENNLGTTNYYFTNGVCTYETGGCVGNPQVGVTYTCCSTGSYRLP